jgi:uncharacterized membrane protein (DUF106 family)
MKNNLKNTAWIDLLILKIDGQRIPAWLFYPLLIAVIGFTNMLNFGNNSEMIPSDDFFGAFILAWFLALLHLLQRLAKSTFDQFRPSFALSKGKIENFRNRFLFAPAWLGWLTLAFGVQTFATQLSFGIQDGLLETARFPILAVIMGFILFAGSTSFTMYYMFNSVRRLLLIVSFHKQIKQVDPFNLDPLRAFSRYTSATAIGMLLTTVVNSPFITDIEGLIFFAAFILLALAVFITPLIGLRNLINDERDQNLTEVMADIKNIAQKISKAIRANEEEKLGTLKSGMDSLLTYKSELLKIQTWPWKTGTIRSFSTAFLLPIFLWLITRILERFI